MCGFRILIKFIFLISKINWFLLFCSNDPFIHSKSIGFSGIVHLPVITHDMDMSGIQMLHLLFDVRYTLFDQQNYSFSIFIQTWSNQIKKKNRNRKYSDQRIIILHEATSKWIKKPEQRLIHQWSDLFCMNGERKKAKRNVILWRKC